MSLTFHSDDSFSFCSADMSTPCMSPHVHDPFGRGYFFLPSIHTSSKQAGRLPALLSLDPFNYRWEQVDRDKFGRKAEKAGSIMKSLARLGVYTPRRDISTHLTDVSFWSIGLVFLFAFASLPAWPCSFLWCYGVKIHYNLPFFTCFRRQILMTLNANSLQQHLNDKERGRLPPPKIFGVTICGVQFPVGNIQRRICTFGTESVMTKVNNEN